MGAGALLSFLALGAEGGLGEGGVVLESGGLGEGDSVLESDGVGEGGVVLESGGLGEGDGVLESDGVGERGGVLDSDGVGVGATGLSVFVSVGADDDLLNFVNASATLSVCVDMVVVNLVWSSSNFEHGSEKVSLSP